MSYRDPFMGRDDQASGRRTRPVRGSAHGHFIDAADDMPQGRCDSMPPGRNGGSLCHTSASRASRHANSKSTQPLVPTIPTCSPFPSNARDTPGR